MYLAIDIKHDEVHCKLQNCVYLLNCTHNRIQYIVESITPFNLRIDIQRRGKSGCQISTYHYRIVYKKATLSIQVIEKLPENGYENRITDKAILEYQFQREDY